MTDKRVEYLETITKDEGGGAEMITPSKEGSEGECGKRVEVDCSSDILMAFLNTDTCVRGWKSLSLSEA